MKRILAFLFSVVFALSFPSCAYQRPLNAATGSAPSDKTASGKITVTDMIGREVTILPGDCQRVVCIGAGALRMYSYVGDVSLLCGVEDVDNLTLASRPKMFDASARPYVSAYKEVFSALPSCGVGGPNAQTAEVEKILSCAPGIVISEYEDADRENALQEQLGVPVITLRSGPDSVFGESFKGSMRLLGRIFNREQRAEEIVSFIERERAEIERRTASIPEEQRPTVYLCGLGNWGSANHLTTVQNGVLFEIARLKNAVDGLPVNGVVKIDEEKFLSLGERVDILLLDAAALKNLKTVLRDRPDLFDSFKAAKKGEVYLQPAYNAYYTNYEIALANAWFAAKIAYPSLFEDIDLTDKTNEITRAFLHKDLAEEIFAAGANAGCYGRISVESIAA